MRSVQVGIHRYLVVPDRKLPLHRATRASANTQRSLPLAIPGALRRRRGARAENVGGEAVNTAHWSETLPKNACRNALTWARKQKSARAAWRDCERGDWMLWLLGRQAGAPGSDARRNLVLAACACARLALPYVKESDDHPRVAIETAEAWARGGTGITLDQIREAAAYAAYADADAAYAAAAAAYAAYAAADAAAAAAYAAYADAAAAADAAYAKRKTILKQYANIVRQHYPATPELGTKP